jgi:hypothetical protein
MVRALTLRALRTALLLALFLAVGLTVRPVAARAAISLRQTGTEATGTGTSISPTLSSSSQAGTLLVAVLTSASTSTFSGPTGWTRATGTSSSTAGRADIWYYPNNPGGITSATFTTSGSGGAVAGELTEWNGVALGSPLDTTGSTTCGSATSCSVSASSGTTSLPNDVGITAFTTLNSPTCYGAGSGWTHIFSDPTTDDAAADYRTGLSSGSTISETETDCSTTNDWAAAIATFKIGCTGGSLTLGAPSASSFSSVTLNGTDVTRTTSLVLTPDDESGTGSSWNGWNITGTSTTFTDTSGHQLSTAATAVTAASRAAATGNCNLPTNSIGYPVTLPAGAPAPTAVKLYNAAANTGEGPTNVTLTMRLSVPANAYKGTYTSTWTFAVVSGP